MIHLLHICGLGLQEKRSAVWISWVPWEVQRSYRPTPEGRAVQREFRVRLGDDLMIDDKAKLPHLGYFWFF
jgi:hypothetical protein